MTYVPDTHTHTISTKNSGKGISRYFVRYILGTTSWRTNVKTWTFCSRGNLLRWATHGPSDLPYDCCTQIASMPGPARERERQNEEGNKLKREPRSKDIMQLLPSPDTLPTSPLVKKGSLYAPQMQSIDGLPNQFGSVHLWAQQDSDRARGGFQRVALFECWPALAVGWQHTHWVCVESSNRYHRFLVSPSLH